MRIFLTLLFILQIFTVSIGQENPLRIQLGIGISKMLVSKELNSDMDYRFGESFEVGVIKSFVLKTEKLRFNSGILFSILTDYSSGTTDVFYSGEYWGMQPNYSYDIGTLVRRTNGIIAIPLSLELQVNKWNVEFGNEILINCLEYAESETIIRTFTFFSNPAEIYSIPKQYNQTFQNTFNHSLILTFGYMVSPRIKSTLKFRNSTTNVLDKEYWKNKAQSRYQQILLGMEFFL